MRAPHPKLGPTPSMSHSARKQRQSQLGPADLQGYSNRSVPVFGFTSPAPQTAHTTVRDSRLAPPPKPDVDHPTNTARRFKANASPPLPTPPQTSHPGCSELRSGRSKSRESSLESGEVHSDSLMSSYRPSYMGAGGGGGTGGRGRSPSETPRRGHTSKRTRSPSSSRSRSPRHRSKRNADYARSRSRSRRGTRDRSVDRQRDRERDRRARSRSWDRRRKGGRWERSRSADSRRGHDDRDRRDRRDRDRSYGRDRDRTRKRNHSRDADMSMNGYDQYRPGGSPKRKRSRSRQRSRSKRRERSRSKDKERSRSRRRSWSRKRSRSPRKRTHRSRTPQSVRHRSKTPPRRRSKSPVRLRSRTPVRRRSKTPIRDRSRTPVRRRSKSPIRNRSRSPRRQSRTPVKETRKPSLSRSRSRSRHHRKRSQSRSRSARRRPSVRKPSPAASLAPPPLHPFSFNRAKSPSPPPGEAPQHDREPKAEPMDFIVTETEMSDHPGPEKQSEPFEVTKSRKPSQSPLQEDPATAAATAAEEAAAIEEHNARALKDAENLKTTYKRRGNFDTIKKDLYQNFLDSDVKAQFSSQLERTVNAELDRDPSLMARDRTKAAAMIERRADEQGIYTDIEAYVDAMVEGKRAEIEKVVRALSVAQSIAPSGAAATLRKQAMGDGVGDASAGAAVGAEGMVGIEGTPERPEPDGMEVEDEMDSDADVRATNGI